MVDYICHYYKEYHYILLYDKTCMNIEVATASTMLCQCSQMVSMRQLSLYHIGIDHLLNFFLIDMVQSRS